MDLKVTFALFYGPDFLDAANESMHEKSQWVTWNLLVQSNVFWGEIRCLLICHQIISLSLTVYLLFDILSDYIHVQFIS